MPSSSSLKIVKVEVPGRGLLSAVECTFSVIQEAWSQYQVSDGGIIRMRSTALRIYRVVGDDGRPSFLPDGQRDYIVTQQTQMVSPEGGL